MNATKLIGVALVLLAILLFVIAGTGKTSAWWGALWA